MKKSIITITGKNGSGKSTTGKRLAEMLGYTHKSGGDFMRAGAMKHNMGIAEFMIYAETHSEVDEETDQMLKDCGKEENLVIDARIAFFWIPESFKVYLDLDFDTAVERVQESLKNDPLRLQSEDTSNTHDEMKQKLIQRYERDAARYKTKYNIDTKDMSQFDLVINTGDPHNTLDVVVQTVFDAYQTWKSQD